MGPLFILDGKRPSVGKDVFVAPTAAVVGDVTIGDGASIWFSAVVRGDDMPILIGPGTNVQDGAIVHSTENIAGTSIGSNVVIGHGAILHGCTIGDGALIGMGAIILDEAVVGAGAVIAAGAVVPPGKMVPPNSLWLGNPPAVKRDTNVAERDFVSYAVGHYAEQAVRYKNNGIG
ncbi:MAG: gamma carbonic anhydrase family protein [Sphingopyxis sp.]|nr:gamma carbonic anhydrase family protein [Sphingopyxis sp.]